MPSYLGHLNLLSRSITVTAKIDTVNRNVFGTVTVTVNIGTVFVDAQCRCGIDINNVYSDSPTVGGYYASHGHGIFILKDIIKVKAIITAKMAAWDVCLYLRGITPTLWLFTNPSTCHPNNNPPYYTESGKWCSLSCPTDKLIRFKTT
jgi:hypothetical protein